MTGERELRIAVPDLGGVGALHLAPARPRALYVLAHGAGAGMRHPFLAAIAAALAERGIATLRYDFPYAAAGRRRPDRPPVLVATVRAAVDAARELAGDLPLLAGGKSMGGRMTSTAAAQAPLEAVRGIAFLGFPLHAPGRPPAGRADHLARVGVPMLFLQGDRDRLARLDLLEPVVAGLDSRATLHVVAGGDHSFKVLQRSGRTEAEVMAELAESIDRWAAERVEAPR